MPMLHVRLTEPEMEAVKFAAHARGVNLSAHVRTCLFPTVPVGPLERPGAVPVKRAEPFVHPRLGVAALRESGPLPPEPAKPDPGWGQMTVPVDPKPRRKAGRTLPQLSSRAHFDGCLLVDREHEGECKVPLQVAQGISAAERAHRTHAILERASHSKPREPRR
jgi:hypothetical protein